MVWQALLSWYGPMNQTMSLLKPINNTFLIPYEQAYIQFLHQKGKLNKARVS
jgi:hypothetical protein